MIDFEMEIFTAGSHTDSSGATADYPVSYLEDIAKNYDPSYRESPLVIGHPGETAPAYGWVKQLKVVGTKLVAIAQAVPQFAEAIKQGLYKKRSARFYTNYHGKGPYLAHVGFFGAAPVAVPGLADIQFTAEDKQEKSLTFDFQQEEKTMGIKEKIKAHFAEFMEKLNGLPDDGSVPPGTTTVVVKQPEKQFSEADLQAKVTEAAAKAKEDATKEFAEQLKAEQKKTADVLDSQRKQGIKDFCEALKKDGKLLPAWEKLGLVTFMEQLGSTDTVEFAEGADKQTPLDFMKKFLAELPKTVSFKETTAADPSTGSGATAGAKLDALTQAKMKDNKDLTYSLAFAEVQKEHPALVQEYATEMQ
jgi:hypothetical protein